eukprot:188887-Karenia_brevis.AAC.1
MNDLDMADVDMAIAEAMAQVILKEVYSGSIQYLHRICAGNRFAPLMTWDSLVESDTEGDKRLRKSVRFASEEEEARVGATQTDPEEDADIESDTYS